MNFLSKKWIILKKSYKTVITLHSSFNNVAGFKLSPSEGIASCVLGLQQQTETKAIDVDKWMFIVLDQGMAQKTLRYDSTWMEGKEGRKLYKKWTHYEAMMNDTWAMRYWIKLKDTWIGLAFIYLQKHKWKSKLVELLSVRLINELVELIIS